jgi:hypothetical protein
MMVALLYEGRMKRTVHVSGTTLGTHIVLLVLSAMIGACSHRITDLSPAFTVDLQPWGYSNEPSGPPTASYSSLAFLSNDIVLVAINERRFTKAVELSLTDEPASKVLLFSIRPSLLVTTAQIPVEKQPGAVQISEGGHFSVWNESGIQLCDLELKCTAPARFSGPILASPNGSAIVVGGWGQNGQKQLDGLSLRELATYPPGNPAVVPGDGVLLLRYSGHKFFLKENSNVEKPRPIRERVVNEVLLPESRFLNRSMIAVDETNENLLVAGLNGKPLYRVPIDYSMSNITVSSCVCQTEFAVREQRYTRWNSITHFTDIENTRPFDFERVRVFDASSGRVLFSLEQDPRPYIAASPRPTLSPDGRHIALVDRGILNVYRLPETGKASE